MPGIEPPQWAEVLSPAFTHVGESPSDLHQRQGLALLLAGPVRYFMHISDANGFVEDEEGRELPGDEAARKEAVAAARDIMAGDLRGGRVDLA